MTEADLKDILRNNPGDFPALRALEALYSREGRMEEMVEVLKAEAQAAPDASERAWLTYRRARIEEDELKDAVKALETYASVQGDQAWELLAFRARERIYREQGDMEGLASLLSSPPTGISGPENYALQLDLARVLAQRLGQPEKARGVLRDLLDQKPDDLFSALSLIQILVDARDWQGLARGYQEMSSLARSSEDTLVYRILCYRLGQIYEGYLNNPDQAQQFYESATGDEGPADLALALAELIEAGGGDSSGWISRLVLKSREGDPPMFDLFSYKLAQVQELDLEQPVAAVQTLEGLLEKKPDNIPALFDLERIYRGAKDVSKLENVITRLAEVVEEPISRLDYLETLAKIALEEFNQPELALEHARKARQVAPEGIGPIKFMQHLLHQRADWSGLMELLDEEIDKTGDPRELQGLYFFKAEVANYGLENHDLAIEAYRQTLEIPPSQFPALKSLERLYRKAGDWENLIRVISALRRLLTEKEYQVYYSLETARLWEQRLGRDDQAFAVYSEVIKADPQNWAALCGVARICLRQAAWDNLIASNQRLLSLVNDVSLRHALILQTARIYEKELNNPGKAAELYQSLVELLPDTPHAHEHLRMQSFRDKNHIEYITRIKALSELARSAEFKAAFLVRAALAQECGLAQAGPARADYESAFGLVQNDGLFLALLELAQLEGDWERYVSLAREFSPRLNTSLHSALLWHTAQVMNENLSTPGGDLISLLDKSRELSGDQVVPRMALSRALLSEQDYPSLLDIFQKELEGREEGSERLELRLARAEIIRDKQGNIDGAIKELQEALQETGDRVDIIRVLEDLFEKTQNWSELIRIIMKEIHLRKDTSLLISLYQRLARHYEDKFSADEEAIKSYQAIIRISPDHLESHKELSRLYDKGESYEDLVKTLLAQVPLLEDRSDQVSIYMRAAEIYDEKLGQVEQAIESLQKALELDPSRKETLSELERIYDRESRYQGLIDVLEKQIGLAAEPEVLAELHTRVASLWEERLNEDARAIESYIKARELKPRDEGILRALERLFERESRWEDLINTLERLAEITADPSERMGFYLRIGSLWEERLDQAEPAIDSFRRVLEVEPRHVEALNALDRLYQKTENYSALVEILLSLVEAVPEDITQCVNLLLRVGRVQEEQFENQEGALSAYEQAMGKDPSAIEPIRAGRDLRERREEWDEVVELWKREEPLVAKPEEKKKIFYTIGDISENKLMNRDEATVFYEKALGIDKEYLPAVKPLAEIYFDSKAWDRARPLYDIWSREAEAEGVDKAAEIFFRQGWIAEQLQDIELALQRYLRSSETKPSYLAPLERLSELYLSQENYSQAEVFFERVLLIEQERQDTERVFEVLHALGGIEVKLKKTEAAIGRFEDALAIKPGHYETLRSLIPLYLEKQDWQKLLSTYDQSIRSAPGPDLVAEGLVEKGDVLEKHLSQAESATAHYRKAVEIKPEHLSGWEHLGQVYIKQKQWPEAIEALLKLIELEEDSDKRTEYNYQAGKIYQEGFNDLEKAREYFEGALKLNETHIPSMEAIGLIYLKQKEWNKYLDLTHRFVKLIPREQEENAVPLYMKMGEVYRDFLDEKEKAIIEFQNVTRINPEHEDARSALASLYISDKNFYNNAIKENMILLRQNTFRIQSYRDLGTIYEGLNRLDEVYCVYSVLDVIKSLNPAEKMFFEAHQPQVVKESKRSLNEESHEKVLVHPDERGALHDMLVLMGDYLDKIFSPDLEKMGAKKTFKAQPTSTSPMKKLADELAHNLGIEEYDLYLIPTVTEPRVASTSPPSLIISQEWFNPFKPEERRFLMGRVLEHLKSRHALVLNFSPDKVVKTLFLLAKLFKPEIKIPGMSEDEVQSEMKNIKRAVPRKIRNQLEKTAVAFATEGARADVERWLNGITHTANRAGLLVANNLPASISALMKTHPKFKKMRYDDLGDPIPILEQSEEVIEMILFSISDSYFTLRRRAGFSLLSI